MNSDPTWEVIDNWYLRSWEVCIGVITASIPALRPGYKTLSASISSYRSRRTLRKTSDGALVSTGKDHKFQAAVQAASAEADRAEAYGAGEDGFAMNYLPGDKKTTKQGIKKTTTIDIAGTTAGGSERSLELGNMGRGLRNRDFV